MGGNPKATESQPHKNYRQALTENGGCAKEEEQERALYLNLKHLTKRESSVCFMVLK